MHAGRLYAGKKFVHLMHIPFLQVGIQEPTISPSEKNVHFLPATATMLPSLFKDSEVEGCLRSKVIF